MTPAYALEGQLLAQELYALLRALDGTPAEEVRPELAKKADTLAMRLRAALASDWFSAPAVRRGLAEMARYLEDFRQKLAQGRTEPSVFRTFRARAAPAYEAFAASLRAADVPAPTLRPANAARSIMHMTSGFLGVAATELAPWWLVITIAAGFFAFSWTMEYGRRRSEAFQRFGMFLFGRMAHPHERVRINSATWYATALMALSLTFNPHACAIACIVLGLGDPAAAAIGRKFGRHRIFAGRSLEGSLGFVAVGTLAALGILVAFSAPYTLGTKAIIALVAGVTGAVTELFSRSIDDNLSIPLAVGAASLLAMHVVG